MSKKSIIALLLSGVMMCSFALTGCNNGGGEKKGEESSKSSVQSTAEGTSENESEDPGENSEEESSKSESSKEESSKEESSKHESSQPREFDLENDIKLSTVAVSTIPYDEDYFGSGYVPTDKMTVVTMIIQSKYIDDLKYGTYLTTLDDQKHYSDKGTLFNQYKFYIFDNDSRDTKAYLVYFIAAGDHKPSEYKLNFEFDGQNLSKPLSDEVSEIPQDVITADVLHVGNIGKIGDDYYFISSCEGTSGGGTMDKVEGYDDSYSTSYKGAILRIKADPSVRLDFSQFTYEPAPENAGNKFLDRYVFKVETQKVAPAQRSFKNIYEMTWLYGYNDSESSELLEELWDFNRDLVDSFYSKGYIVYNGTKIAME